MRFTFCLSSLYIILSAGAFNFQSLPRSTLTKLKALSTAEDAKASLIETVKRIESECGLFVYDANAKSDLTQAVSEFEAVASSPSLDDFQTKFQGDWRLLCTTVATDQKGFELSKLPFVNEGPLKQIRKSLNRSVKVLQKIQSTSGSTTVDRIDHVIEYTPPSSLSEVIEDLPDILRTLNLNPLELTKSTVTLVHKAEVEGIVPTLTTKLSLQRVILNVAGENQLLDPKGADIVGLNVPLGEFLNTGSFDTTYLDDNLRISRGKLGFIDQLRVFVREGEQTKFATNEGGESIDIDEVKDIEWIDDNYGNDDFPSDVEQ